MESPSQIDRRQAWARSSLRKFPGREESPASHDPHLSLQDDVFVDGCSAGKIETWLQGCGKDASPSRDSHLTKGPLRTGASFEDDLSLGAEATALYTASDRFRTPKQKLDLPLLNMGQSMASSAFSNFTNRTVSSVSEVLQMRAEDAEDTLFQLGFGCEEPQVTARIPVRFLNFPSQLRGINFRLFLKSQLARIHQEDPCLSLASRFRQVEALTAMANAFYSLYSHVSRTPLQKLAPPQLTISSPLAERCVSRTSIRSEPRSPVERLKDTISKMCLYTRSRGSDSASPNGSPRKRKCSLSSLAGNVTETLWNTDDQVAMPNIQMKEDLEPDMDWYVGFEKELEETVNLEKVFETESSQDSGDHVHNPRCKSSEHTSTSDKESKGSSSLSSTSVTMVPLITHDVICPQVIEYVNQAPYLCLETNSTDVKGSLIRQTGAIHQTYDLPTHEADASQKSLCQITITGWENDAAIADQGGPGSPNIHKYLSPEKTLKIQWPKQGNSFELEEVHSAEEEEHPSSEFGPADTLSVSAPNKSSPLRGDSFQSDSSGYVEEDIPHLSVKRDVCNVTSHAQQTSAEATA